MGNNTAGIKAKKDSLEAVIKLLGNPSCITLQETKLAKKSVFQLNDYQVFHKNRNSAGGGLSTAVDPSLNPMMISTKNEEADILTVQLEVNKQKIRLINGYGPQDDDNLQNRLNFWLGLDQEIISAKSESCLVMIQMDANVKVGSNLISADPNTGSDGNGRQMLELMERHGLQLLNADKLCTGTVTRYRVTKKGTEAAILDYVLVCQELYEFFEKMEIDEDRNYTLTRYATKKGNKKIVSSDHNPMLVTFNMKYIKIQNNQIRKEIFNLKNSDCQTKFYEETNHGLKCQQCFDSGKSFEENTRKFFNTLDDTLHKCFRKIRIKSNRAKVGGIKGELQDLIMEKTRLSLSLPTIKCLIAKQIMENEISKLEEKISEISASKNASTVSFKKLGHI